MTKEDTIMKRVTFDVSKLSLTGVELLTNTLYAFDNLSECKSTAKFPLIHMDTTNEGLARHFIVIRGYYEQDLPREDEED